MGGLAGPVAQKHIYREAEPFRLAMQNHIVKFFQNRYFPFSGKNVPIDPDHHPCDRKFKPMIQKNLFGDSSKLFLRKHFRILTQGLKGGLDPETMFEISFMIVVFTVLLI
jgi:hypothetical protein